MVSRMKCLHNCSSKSNWKRSHCSAARDPYAHINLFFFFLWRYPWVWHANHTFSNPYEKEWNGMEWNDWGSINNIPFTDVLYSELEEIKTTSVGWFLRVVAWFVTSTLSLSTKEKAHLFPGLICRRLPVQFSSKLLRNAFNTCWPFRSIFSS